MPAPNHFLGMLRSKFHNYSRSPVFRNTLWMLVGKGLLLVIQAIYFILIARHLGPHNYGAFVGVMALVAILAPFVGIGSINLLLKNVSRDQSVFSEYWGNTLLMNLTTGTVMLGFVLLISRIFLPSSIPLILVILVAFSDLVVYRLTGACTVAFQAFERLDMMAKLNVASAILRLIAAGLLVLFIKQPTAVSWAVFYLCSTAAGCVLAMFVVHRRLGKPSLALHRIRPELQEGFYFSISLSAANIYNDVDKTALARLATLQAAGIYAAAYRIIDALYAPVTSLVSATYPRFFQRGALGLSGSLQYARTLMSRAAVYALGVTLGVLLCAPLAPRILGESYINAVPALQLLAVIPLLRSIHYFLANSLTGSGFQGTRSAIQVLVALFNIGLDIWLIPIYSWRGAAWASVASDSLLVIGFLLAIGYRLRRQAVRIPASAADTL